MGKHKLIHKFSLMNLTWANVTVRSLVPAPLELWPAGDNITHWGQLRSCRYSEKLRDDMGFKHIQPIYGKSFGMIWLFDLMIWFDDLNWVYLIFSGWDDETSIHSSCGLVKSTFRHREPLNTGWKSWDTNNAVQTALPKDGETFGCLISNSQEKSQSNQTLLAVDEHHELWESDISFWFLSVPLNRRFSRLCFRHVSNSK